MEKISEIIEAQQLEESQKFARLAGQAALAQLAKEREQALVDKNKEYLDVLAPLLAQERPRVFTPQGPGTLRGINLENSAPVTVKVDYDSHNASNKLYHFYFTDIEAIQSYSALLEQLFDGVKSKEELDNEQLEKARKNKLVQITRSGFVAITPYGVELLLEIRDIAK